MPNTTETSNAKKRGLFALLLAILAVAAALVAFFVVPSCQSRGMRNTGEPPHLRTEEISRPESGPLAQGEIGVVNSEELYVRLSDDDLASVYASDPEGLTVHVAIGTRGSGGSVWSKTYRGNALKQDGSWGEGGTEVGIVLDSLREGQSLKDQTDDSGVTLSRVVQPGGDMFVYAAALYQGSGIDNGEGEEVNSLYAGLEEANGRLVAVVSTLRHLANLDSSRAADDAYQSVRIANDVGFYGGTWNDPASVSPAARKGGAAALPIAHLDPIALVSGANEKDAAITGDDHAIRGVVVGDSAHPTDDIGVFATLACEVSHLTIANASVAGGNRTGALAGDLKEGANVHHCTVAVEENPDGTYPYSLYQVKGTNAVGGLAGRAKGATVRNCLSFVTVVGESNVGGLVGEMSGGAVGDSGVRAAFVGESGDTPAPDVVGDISVGGLVGSAKSGTTIDRSYGAVNVYSNRDAAEAAGQAPAQKTTTQQGTSTNQTGQSNAAKAADSAMTTRFGGLAGTLEDNVEVRNCYATGSVRGQAEAGGLAGRAKASNIRNCYATGDVRCNTLGGGFVGDVAGDGVIEHSFSYGLVTNVAGKPIAENGGFFGYNEGKKANINDTNAFLREGGYNDAVSADANKGDGSSYGRGVTTSNLMVDDGTITHVSKVHGYRADLKGQTFPFEDVTGLDEIWGNWPVMRLASWYRDNGELIVQRQVPTSADPVLDAPLRAAERPQDYYGDQGPYYLFLSWDQGYEPNGDFVAVAQVMELPFDEFFMEDPVPAWMADVRDQLTSYLNDDWTAVVNFTIDSQAPDSPSNPEAFSYQIKATQGQAPIFIMGQKLPNPGQPVGQYRALRYDIGANTLQVGYVTAKDAEMGGIHYFAYDQYTADPVPES